MQAARLVPDGGTLQLGIGALGDAIAQSLVIRQNSNNNFKKALAQLDAPVVTGPCTALDRPREFEGQRRRLTEDGEPCGGLSYAFAGVLAMGKHSVEDCHYPRQHKRA